LQTLRWGKGGEKKKKRGGEKVKKKDTKTISAVTMVISMTFAVAKKKEEEGGKEGGKKCVKGERTRATKSIESSFYVFRALPIQWGKKEKRRKKKEGGRGGRAPIKKERDLPLVLIGCRNREKGKKEGKEEAGKREEKFLYGREGGGGGKKSGRKTKTLQGKKGKKERQGKIIFHLFIFSLFWNPLV